MKTKIIGTIYGSNFKAAGSRYQEDDEAVAYDDNEGFGYDLNEGYSFVPFPTKPELAWEDVRDCKSIKFEIEYTRAEKETPEDIGFTNNGERIIVMRKSIDAFGGYTDIYLNLNGKVYDSEARCSHRDQFCRKRGIQAALDNFSDTDKKEILEFIKKNK